MTPSKQKALVLLFVFISTLAFTNSESVAQCTHEKIIIYERSYDAIYNSVIETCDKSSFVIKDKNYTTGTVITEFREDKLSFKQVLLSLSFKLEKLDGYKTKIILTISGQKQDGYCFSGQRDYVENTARNVLESLLHFSGDADLDAVMRERKNTKGEKPLLIFNFYSEEVRLWMVRLKIGHSPSVRRDFVSGELYELAVQEGSVRIEYSLASRESSSNEKRFQTKGRPFSGALQYMVINLNLKKNDLIVFTITKTGKQIKAYSCMPGGCLIPPMVWPYRYEEVNLFHRKID